MPRTIRPIRVDGQLAYIPLTQGYEAIIDAADVPLVDGRVWFALVDGKNVYAGRRGPRPARKTIWMHRVIAGTPDGFETDHRDGNGLNNRQENLRTATPSQNRCNQKLLDRNTSGMKGVSPHKASGKFQASISINKKQRHLGLFLTKEDAAAAYAEASAELHGAFGRLS